MKRIILLLVIISLWLFQHNLNAQGGELKHYVEAEKYFKATNWKKALAEYQRALSTAEPNSSNIFKYHYQMSRCYFKIRNAPKAIEAANMSIQSKQDYVPAYLILARLYGKTKKYDEANSALESAFKYEKDSNRKVKYIIKVMRYYAQRRDWVTALEKVKQALAVAPKEPIVNYYYAKISNQNEDYEAAKKAITNVKPSLEIMQKKDYARYYFELGVALYNLKEFNAANRAFKKADFGSFITKVRKYKPQYFLSIATAYFKVHENEISRNYVDKALEIQESYPYAHIMMAQLAKRENEDPSAMIKSLKMAVTHETNFVRKVQLYDKIAELQIDSKQYDECLKTLEESLKIKSDDPMAWFEKSIALYKMGKYTESANTINTILRKTNSKKMEADMHFLLGLALKKDKKYSASKQAFYRARSSSLRNACILEINAVDKISPDEPNKKKK